ncbi:uncharacterized protein, partial [Macrobrachium rosenbergii]|uniref:uncharacterized protein n=1 Tax=Macrobrachium rosenbergii TaxID=79674 RepID=UPI0034D6D294
SRTNCQFERTDSILLSSVGVLQIITLAHLLYYFFQILVGLLAGSSRAEYPGSPNQGANGLSPGGPGGAVGGGFNNNVGINGGGFNNNVGINGGGFNNNVGINGGGGFQNNGGASGGYGGNGGGDPIANLADVIPGGGVPGKDYPILASVPKTGFTCQGQIPGYYADTDQQARCQVFHICQEDGKQDSFLCPNGTIFNQQYFVCDWWFNFDCSTAEQFYGLNAEIGKVTGNGNNGYGGANGNGFGIRDNGLGSPSGAQSPFGGAPGTGTIAVGAPSGSHGAGAPGTGSNGGGGGNFVGGNGDFRGNGIGGVPQAPSGLYQSPN